MYNDGDDKTVDLAEEIFRLLNDEHLMTTLDTNISNVTSERIAKPGAHVSNVTGAKMPEPDTIGRHQNRIEAAALVGNRQLPGGLGFAQTSEGQSCDKSMNDMASIHNELTLEKEELDTQGSWLPAEHVWTPHPPISAQELWLSRAYIYVLFTFVTFGRAEKGTAMLRASMSSAEDELSAVLLGAKGGWH
ncbi:hypothetical protein CYMTET_57098 [Cymbomonas tetramitiformis]|uniref:Uncharacterized protein n=1 Tax=Cymbomonas tetramitiformis TaxID=36881 RepID=A0AAE0B9Y2_9CHLO|nr:hypothetical protein CYMTET_57098 [Cymbomonas tetramitiformis]